jgi:GT2 family glycosyltransferase
MTKVCVVVPNWNGAEELPGCLDSLFKQTLAPKLIVVENGSTDNSLQLLTTSYPEVDIVALDENRGFAGGVNAGIKRAIEEGYEYVALLNNDAVAHRNWLEVLVGLMGSSPKLGIVTSKILSSTSEYIDSTGDTYTIWGLPYPRGRREASLEKYDDDTRIFGASGGASLYRIKMLREIGLFDEDFFAYYEDVDISFRAQLAGWKIQYAPQAKVQHQIGGTSRKVKGFTTYQTMKNLPWLMWKNVPARLMLKVFPRFVLAYFAFYFSAFARGEEWPATKGMLVSIYKWPKKLVERYRIQKRRKVSVDYIESILVHDLPPNAHKLRRLRSVWWKLSRRRDR